MSDFDADAERKRLREKYDAEKESREQTQQMSELLLKGATMTNQHCGECGSPIFRYDEREFCPSCQRTADAAAAGSNAAESAGADAAAAGSTDADAADANGTARREPGAAAADAGADSGTPRTGDAVVNGRDVADAGGPAEHRADRDAGQGVADDAAARHRPDAAADPTPERDGAAPTRQAAQESLLAALTRHARLAGDTDEPRRATDHLKAAREAAAALNELDGS